MDLIEKYLGEAKSNSGRPLKTKGGMAYGIDKKSKIYTGKEVKLVFSKSYTTSGIQQMDEIDALLARSGVLGTPDSDKGTITIDRKDLKKAEKALKGTPYRRYTVENLN